MYIKTFFTCCAALIYKCFAENVARVGEVLIVGGKHLNITKVPYVAALSISCNDFESIFNNIHQIYSCGGSILNQRIVLTAAHCLENCTTTVRPEILVGVGHTNKHRGDHYVTNDFKMHENYNTEFLHNDIALIFMEENIILSKRVAKVAIMKYPPSSKKAYVAGWGYVDEQKQLTSNTIRGLRVKLLSREKCLQYKPNIRPDAICAGSTVRRNRYISRGDSGNALVVQNYIQIGLLSSRIHGSLGLYTDVAYHYDWIMNNSIKGLCGS